MPLPSSQQARRRRAHNHNRNLRLIRYNNQICCLHRKHHRRHHAVHADTLALATARPPGLHLGPPPQLLPQPTTKAGPVSHVVTEICNRTQQPTLAHPQPQPSPPHQTSYASPLRLHGRYNSQRTRRRANTQRHPHTRAQPQLLASTAHAAAERAKTVTTKLSCYDHTLSVAPILRTNIWSCASHTCSLANPPHSPLPAQPTRIQC